MKVLGAVVLSVLVCVVVCEVEYQYPEEWDLWKTEHGKSYQSREELERHLVWLSNREYINAHNANSDIFGFTLTMNHFGDIVSSSYFCDKIHKFLVNIFSSLIRNLRSFIFPRGLARGTTTIQSILTRARWLCLITPRPLTGGLREQSATSRTRFSGSTICSV